MATNKNFGRETTAQEVVDSFGDQIKGRTGESLWNSAAAGHRS